MLYRRFLPLVLVAVASHAFALASIVLPPGPTSADEVTLRVPVTCGGASHSVSFLPGQFIAITIVGNSTVLCDPPAPYLYDVPLGKLALGLYRWTAQSPNDVVWATGEFVVRNAAAVPFDTHPFAVPVGRTSRAVVYSRGAGGFCSGNGCSDVTVRVGGVLAPDVHVISNQEINFIPPGLGKGMYYVSVTSPGISLTSSGALYYFDPAQPPDMSVFEPLLFPALFETSGANGSFWISEAIVSNRSPWRIENYNEISELVCVTLPCGEQLPGGHYEKIRGKSYPHGVNLLIPRAESSSLAFGLRVRDTSRVAESLGTEVPIVRESELQWNTLTLLDVPVDPRYRSALRVYAVDPGPAQTFSVYVSFINREKHQSSSTFVQMTRSCSVTCAITPAYGQLDLPAGAAGESIDIQILPPGNAPIWALVSVTNNDTQQVTLVSPWSKDSRR